MVTRTWELRVITPGVPVGVSQEADPESVISKKWTLETLIRE